MTGANGYGVGAGNAQEPKIVNGVASVARTSTSWPINSGGPSKATISSKLVRPTSRTEAGAKPTQSRS